MSTPSHFDLASPAEALLWLVEMGADEIIMEQPVDRFADSAKLVSAKPAPKLEIKSAPAPKPSVPCAPTTDVSGLHSIVDIAQALNFMDTHPLRKNASKLAFFEGPERTEVLILADRPRNEEDKAGLVFAGKSRILLTNMLAAINLRLEDVALMNLIPWRPPGNRAPTEAEISAVLPFARRALELARPRLILAFSALPAQHLVGADPSILRQRGKWQALGEAALLSTLHPDELLKFPLQKKLAWRDLLTFKEKL